MQTVLFRLSGPHQCSADAGVEVSGYSPLRRCHTCGIIVPCQSAQTSKLVSYAIYIYLTIILRGRAGYRMIENQRGA